MNESLEVLDSIRLNFNNEGLLLLNFTIAFVMFGVALGLKFENFKAVFSRPKSALIGVISQFVLLPAMTYLLILLLNPSYSVAMGMILVAACPGGNVSNFITSLANGNTELSVSLTGIADLSAIFMTPINFALWAGIYNSSADGVTQISVDTVEMLRLFVFLLGVPVIIGMLFSSRFPNITKKIIKPIKIISVLIFLSYIIGALSLNLKYFLLHIHLIFLIVLIHNLLAFSIGYSMANLFRLPPKDKKTITIETGIQNSGLGLVLIFNPNLFNGLGGMAFIAAWWGIWHVISGLSIAVVWNKISK